LIAKARVIANPLAELDVMEQGHGGKHGEDWRSQVEYSDASGPQPEDLARANQPGRGREASTPGMIPALGWSDILSRVYYAFSANRIVAMSGGVAFFTLMAIFPAIATIVSLYGLFADAQTVIGHLNLLSGILPAAVLDLVKQQILLVAGKSNDTLGLAFIAGFLIALWSANSGITALFDALNVVYGEREERSLVRLYATSLLFTLAAVLFVITALAGVVVLPIVLSSVGFHTPAEAIVMVARWPILLVVVATALSAIYRFGPCRREAQWRWVTWGSAFAAILWVAVSMAFSWYVASFDSYNRVYGSLGAAVGFMTWIWISVMVVLLGGELNAEMEHQTACDTTEGNPKPLGRRGATMADHVGPTAAEA
jgi:membrane protein